MHIIFYIAIRYNTIKISNISCGFEVLLKRDMSQIKTRHVANQNATCRKLKRDMSRFNNTSKPQLMFDISTVL